MNEEDLGSMRFRDLLAKVDGELDEEDLENLVFLCDSQLDYKTQQSITTAHHLFDALEKKKLISPSDVTLLNILFKIIGRMDLFAMLPENSNFNYECDSDNRFKSRRYQNYVNPFNYLLFHINEEMIQEEVERMRYIYGAVPKNVKISSALDLFKIMRKKQAIKPDNLEHLKAMLETIERPDLLELVDNFSRDNCSSASAVISQSPVTLPDLSANNEQSVSWSVTSLISGSENDLNANQAQTHSLTSWPISSSKNLSRDIWSSPSAVISESMVTTPNLSANNAQSFNWSMTPTSENLSQVQSPTSLVVSPRDTGVNETSRPSLDSRLLPNGVQPHPTGIPPSRIQPPARSMSAPSGAPYKPVTYLNSSYLPHHSIQDNIPISERSAQISEEVAENDSIDDRYPMTSDPRGMCLVFNFDEFNSSSLSEKLKPRAGSYFDEDNLKDCFERLKFEVHIKKNLTLPEMEETLIYYRNYDHTSYDCFACCVLSHGKEGFIYCSDSVTMEISKLISYFNPCYCPSLNGKPKLFFLSCCQGSAQPKAIAHPPPYVPDSYERDGPDDISKSSPETADFLIGYATLSGYASFRDKKKGTLYIQALCDKLTKYHKSHHLMDILLKVNQELSGMLLTINKNNYKQVAAPQFTLTKQVWL